MNERTRHSDPKAAWHGRRIARLRKKRCLTLRAFCDELALATNHELTLTPSAVSRWETGQRGIALRNRKAVAEVLGTDHEDLFCDPPEGWTATSLSVDANTPRRGGLARVEGDHTADPGPATKRRPPPLLVAS
jgi:transcriptional regulator with XRE-family HTH domain